MKKEKKQRHQIKSKFYYIFWGIATVSVVAGQVYVGTGYSVMAESVMGLTHGLTRALRR